MPDPHWSPEVQYKTILPEYAEAWRAWLDGELEVLGYKDEWALFAKLPSFANSPEYYRRKPKDPECSTYPNHPNDTVYEVSKTELADLRTELAELKAHHKLALKGWEREKNERIRLEEIAAEFDEQSKTNDHLSAMLKACKEEMERPYRPEEYSFDDFLQKLIAARDDARSGNNGSPSVIDGLRKLLAERDEILKERDSELVEANARAEHWKRLASEKAVNPTSTCMHDLVKILCVLRDRGTDMVVTVTGPECQGLTFKTYDVVGMAEDLVSLYESARSEVNRLVEENETLNDQAKKSVGFGHVTVQAEIDQQLVDEIKRVTDENFKLRQQLDRGEEQEMEPVKVQRILMKSHLYAAMNLVDLINGNDAAKGTGVTDDDMLTHVELATEKVKKERDLLRLLHVWFLKKAPEHYKGCGLYFDVIAELSSN